MKASQILPIVCKIECLFYDLLEIKSKMDKVDSDFDIIADHEDCLRRISKELLDMAKDKIEFPEEYVLTSEKI